MNALGVHVIRAASVTDESSPVSYQNVAKRLADQMTNGFLLDQVHKTLFAAATSILSIEKLLFRGRLIYTVGCHLEILAIRMLFS